MALRFLTPSSFKIPTTTTTTLQIEEEDYGEIALCVKCTNKIQICSYFRHCCLTNDTTFRELCADLIAKVKAARIEAKEAAAAAEQALREAEEAALEVEAANQHCDTIELSSDDEFNYSANYIKPGEVLHIEEPMYRPSDWDMSLNPTPPAVQCHPREKGKRKLHLCDLCGLKVGHIPTHYLDHSTVATVGCPYCPVKMKAQKSINEHIHTVHFKLVSKTCEICGKGFVHHKTYRYHMVGIGKRALAPTLLPHCRSKRCCAFFLPRLHTKTREIRSNAKTARKHSPTQSTCGTTLRGCIMRRKKLNPRTRKKP